MCWLFLSHSLELAFKSGHAPVTLRCPGKALTQAVQTVPAILSDWAEMERKYRTFKHFLACKLAR